METSGERRAFLFGLTLSELAFLLFFLIALLSVGALKTKSKEITENKRKIAITESTIVKLQIDLDKAVRKIELCDKLTKNLESYGYLSIESNVTLDQAFQKLVEAREARAAENTQIRQTNLELERVLETLRLKSQRDDQRIVFLERTSAFKTPDSARIEIERLDNKIQQVQLENNTLESQLESLGDQARRYELMRDELVSAGLIDKNDDSAVSIKSVIFNLTAAKQRERNLKGQLINLKVRNTGNGLDHPPCWANPDTGKIEYLYNITIYEENFIVSPLWPPHRTTAVKQIPYAFIDTPKSFDHQQFKRQFQHILDWSKAQDPECRHFVRVQDDPKTSKNAYKHNLLTIEHFFYKYLAPGDMR